MGHAIYFIYLQKHLVGVRDSSESALLISVLCGGLPKYSFHAQDCPLFFFMGFVEFRARRGEKIEAQSVNVSF